jgi:hypothetical protein
LLNPPDIVPPPPPKPRLREQLKAIKADKELMLSELLMVCHDRIKAKNLKPEEVKEFDVAGAVHKWLDVLVVQEKNEHTRRQIKSRIQSNF